MDEIWEVISFENIKPNYYEISNFGNVRNIKGCVIKQDVSNAGYLMINFAAVRDNGKSYQRKLMIHRLVMLTFLGKSDDIAKTIVNHIDGNKLNNHITNLEWCTYSENLSHAFRTGLRSQNGISNPGNVYQEEFIHHICKLKEHGLNSLEIIANCISLRPDSTRQKIRVLVNHILAKRRWTSISSQYTWY